MESATQHQAAEINATAAFARARAGALLVDVREPEETREAAYGVPNLLTIPLSEFDRRFAEIPRDREVILACRGGGRSLRATYFLMNHGYTNVTNLAQGLLGWAAQGLPIKGSLPTDSQSAGCCGGGVQQSSCCASQDADLRTASREPSSGCCGGASQTSACCDSPAPTKKGGCC